MIIVSTLTYALGKALGIQQAARELSRQLVEPSAYAPTVLLPVVRTILRLKNCDDLMVYHGAATTLPKARSRAAQAALDSDADLWCMIDDDIETDGETLSRLVAIARSGCVAVLPCGLRTTSDDHRINVLWDGQITLQRGGVMSRAVRRGGCGLMIVPRVALERVRDEYRDTLSYVDDDGVRRVALFAHMFVGDPATQIWLGEDYSFCERLRAAGVELAAPVEGRSVHDGGILDLELAAALA